MNADQIITIERLRRMGYNAYFMRQYRDGAALVAAPAKTAPAIMRLLIRPDGTYRHAALPGETNTTRYRAAQ